MYITKKITTIILCTFSSLFFASCMDDLKEMNLDPLRPEYFPSEGTEYKSDIDLADSISAEELENLKKEVSGIESTFKKFTYEGLYNDYQITTNLTHDIYAGYFANNKPVFHSASPCYRYTDNWSSKRWDHFYQDRSKEYLSLARVFKYVDPELYRNAYYMTRIYYAFLAIQMVDSYGPVPFSAYVRGSQISNNMAYDTEEKVYDMAFRILTQAVDSIKPGESSFTFKDNNDNCYHGDETKWVKFANTLRLRMALRISNVDPERARIEGEAALEAQGGLISSDGDNMKTVPKHAPKELGGEDIGGNENVHAMCSFIYMDAVMSKNLELAYRDQSNTFDPRCGICWFRPSPLDKLKIGEESNKDFNGCEIGSDQISRVPDVYSVIRSNSWESKVLNDSYWFGYSRESVWMSYAETCFLLAEASLRGWKGTLKSPGDYFEDGIRASMKYYKILDRLINKYINGLKIYENPQDNPFLTGEKEGMLEQIITQKWIATFPNGNEGWAEFRRTDYPRLRNILNNRASDVMKGKFIKRIRYTDNEYNYNSDNIPIDYARQDQRIWWDVTDTNDSKGNRLQPNNFR